MKKIEIIGLERGKNGCHYVIHYSIPCGSIVTVRDMIMLENAMFMNIHISIYAYNHKG